PPFDVILCSPFSPFYRSSHIHLYSLSLHDALPICVQLRREGRPLQLSQQRRRPKGYRHPVQRADCPLRGSARNEGDSMMQGYLIDRKSTRLNSSHGSISYAVFCLKKKKWESTPPHL